MIEKMNMSKVEQKKQLKEKRLLTAAFDLFSSKGVNDTSISDIVTHAGIAKGTFYLYFKDKYQLLDIIVQEKTDELLIDAMKSANEKQFENAIDQVVHMGDYIMDYLDQNKKMLKIIYKDLSWGVFSRTREYDDKNYDRLKPIQDKFIDNIVALGKKRDDAEKELYLILELIGGIMYNAIVHEKPYTLKEIRSSLIVMVRRMIKKIKTPT
ncbi:TetR/AcrR family transcriptional regulator [Vallitalea okinawensis]|uniref:TetR/AcrR family transcriptional regulator n=1 Tax=Vallitalea okinawensis TaxID=2078660 RepID=UPI000CFB739A|nr:TetR/AcrR family transcriptional regulator [Vallitalea okinawensis]